MSATIGDPYVPACANYAVIRAGAVTLGGNTPDGTEPSIRNLAFAIHGDVFTDQPVVLAFILRNHQRRLELALNMNGVKQIRGYLPNDSDRSVQLVMEKAIRKGGNYLRVEALNDGICMLSDVVVWHQVRLGD